MDLLFFLNGTKALCFVTNIDKQFVEINLLVIFLNQSELRLNFFKIEMK